ncbi:MAG: hypothetical protein M0Q53_12820 [Prolixibacteraceae bacterium]|nr:hypothetical protein [Prolixibacteraceae bacterium]
MGQTNELWYERNFVVPTAWKNKKVLLNFGAVDWKAIIDQHRSNPCVVTWVPFNEAWGQFKTPEITA